MTKSQAIAYALKGGGVPFWDGEDYDIPVGEAVYSPEEEGWVVRVAEMGEPYSCGEECCGILRPAWRLVHWFSGQKEA